MTNKTPKKPPQLPPEKKRYAVDVYRDLDEDLVIRELNQAVRKLEGNYKTGNKKTLRIPNKSSYEIFSHLKQYLWHQDLALTKVSHAFYDHLMRIKEHKRLGAKAEERDEEVNVILQIGSTGVGKSEVMRKLSKMMNVPYVHATAEQFTTAGYVGRDVEELLKDAIKEAENMGDEELSQYAIIHIDEIDKVINEGVASGRDVGGEAVQEALLKLLDKGEVTLNFKEQRTVGPPKEVTKKMSTKNIFFVLSGAFDGDGISDSIEQIIQKRMNPEKKEIGFGKQLKQEGLTTEERKQILYQVTNKDLTKYKQKGMIRQLQSRISSIVPYTPYTAEELSDIFEKPENSMMEQTQWAFERWGIELEYTPEAIKVIGEEAEKINTGARGLKTVVSRFRDRYGFILSNIETEQLTITEDIIKDSEGMLETVVAKEIERKFLDAQNRKEGASTEEDKDFYKEIAQTIIRTNTEFYEEIKIELKKEIKDTFQKERDQEELELKKEKD